MRTTRAVPVAIPPGRDPFVNTPLLALGAGGDGAGRFWISTWNANVGCLAALVTEDGEARIHRFNDRRHGGFYSAVQEDADTLWLCGDLSRVLRFSLSSGEFEEFPTGAPEALVFQGMALDPETGRLFAAAHDMRDCTVKAFSFDTRERRTVQVHSGFCRDKYMRASFPNGDGSWTLVLHVPGETLLRWSPGAEELEAVSINDSLDTHAQSGGTSYRLIADESGRRYFPGRGWYDPQRREFSFEDPRPEREMTWFARNGETAWGAAGEAGSLAVGRWDMGNGSVQSLCRIPDCTLHGVNVAGGRRIVAVNRFGFFYRFDAQTGELEMSRRLPADSVGVVDCLCRIDEERLLGTPFITQRFWEVNISTGEGYDCGRAAPGGGEILRTWKLGGMVYMAAYTGGQLVEYDPAEHPHFPENPRVVAAPPHAMRPVAGTDDGRNIYYACSAPYGELGSTLTAYDTQSGIARYSVNPLPGQQITSLCFDRRSRSLICGTTVHADCRSRDPESDRGLFARIDPDSLEAVEEVTAPDGADRAVIDGPLGEGKYLCQVMGNMKEPGYFWFPLDASALAVPDTAELCVFPEDRGGMLCSGIPGHFIMRRGQRVELWDMNAGEQVRLLADDFQGYAVKVQEDTVYLLYPREIQVLEGILHDVRCR